MHNLLYIVILISLCSCIHANDDVDDDVGEFKVAISKSQKEDGGHLVITYRAMQRVRIDCETDYTTSEYLYIAWRQPQETSRYVTAFTKNSLTLVLKLTEYDDQTTTNCILLQKNGSIYQKSRLIIFNLSNQSNDPNNIQYAENEPVMNNTNVLMYYKPLDFINFTCYGLDAMWYKIKNKSLYTLEITKNTDEDAQLELTLKREDSGSSFACINYDIGYLEVKRHFATIQFELDANNTDNAPFEVYTNANETSESTSEDTQYGTTGSTTDGTSDGSTDHAPSGTPNGTPGTRSRTDENNSSRLPTILCTVGAVTLVVTIVVVWRVRRKRLPPRCRPPLPLPDEQEYAYTYPMTQVTPHDEVYNYVYDHRRWGRGRQDRSHAVGCRKHCTRTNS